MDKKTHIVVIKTHRNIILLGEGFVTQVTLIVFTSVIGSHLIEAPRSIILLGEKCMTQVALIVFIPSSEALSSPICK